MGHLIVVLHIYDREKNNASRSDGEDFSFSMYDKLNLSAAWPSGSERRFCDGHDRKVEGSTPTLASMLRPWIRCFTTIISAWWNLTSRNLKKSEAKLNWKTWKQGNS